MYILIVFTIVHTLNDWTKILILLFFFPSIALYCILQAYETILETREV